MRFVFLAHWGVERNATTERLAEALAVAGHDVLHLVLPRRNLFEALRYDREERSVESRRLWSPVARLAPMRSLDVFFAMFTVRRWLARHPAGDLAVVLQSAFFLPLAARLTAPIRIYAAIDVLQNVDASGCVAWSTHVFCCSRVQETELRARFPRHRVENLGQCGRSLAAFDGERDLTPTIVYVGGPHARLRTDLLVRLAQLSARLLLIGCDSVTARDMFRHRLPENVEPLGWLSGPAFGRAVSRAWVGVIPYDERHPFAAQSNPDKTFDYMMAGLSVVSTPIPELIGSKGVTIASSETFERAVQAALEAYRPETANSQRRLGAAHSAERYANRFLEWISTN